MRSMTRSMVSATAVVGLAIGTLTSAGTSFAASAPAAQAPTVSGGTFGALATYNFGLTATQAKGIQRFLAGRWGYTGSIDGLLGTNSWKAFQRCLAKYWGYTDPIDGIPGPDTIRALQRFLASHSLYDGPIDGIAGPDTRAALGWYADNFA
ncbi:peptidoglycan-binding domain-containing protein [Streptomyces sp. NPDC047974]|uniref:peptidoglycan-binding domain-containing protein n=1 Tax=Streptomyces sp. NPDC047974 TaxID=3154343 RepID=UPI0033DE7563